MGCLYGRARGKQSRELTVDVVVGAVFSGLSDGQLAAARATGKLVPYDWRNTGKDRGCLEAFQKVLLNLLNANRSGIYNKLLLQDAMNAINRKLDYAIKNPEFEAIAVKQLLMDIAKKKNSTSGVRQPAWMMQLFAAMSGDGDLDEQPGQQETCTDIVAETEVQPALAQDCFFAIHNKVK